LCKKKFLVSRNRFCQQIPSADFCCQQIFFLSADSISKFLLTADFFFVSKCLCRHHLNDAHAGIYSFAPGLLLVGEVLPSAVAQFRFYDDSIRFAGPSRKSGRPVGIMEKPRTRAASHAKLFQLKKQGRRVYHVDPSF
jgi:hypothetical protein